MSPLQLELVCEAVAPGQEPALQGRYTNRGTSPLALAFWWNRRLRVRDAAGNELAPGPGPVLPCGVAEEWTVLAPGETHTRPEPLACTQPAGRREAIGWSYALPPGTWRVSLIFEAPAAHGFSQSEPHPHAFQGRVESPELTVVIPPPPPRSSLQGLWARLTGG